MPKEIAIVDIGRGPQLSTSRITVQDVVPYFQLNYTYDEIREVMPTLSVEEIGVIEQYFQENREAMLEMDRRIRERNANRTNPPEVEAILRRGREKALARLAAIRDRRGPRRNGEGAPS